MLTLRKDFIIITLPFMSIVYLVLQLLLITLRLVGLINWNWLWVISPTWVIQSMYILLCVTLLIIYLAELKITKSSIE